MRLRPPEVPRFTRVRGWLIPAALLALAPKCVLCVAAYAGFGALLGFGGPELCSSTADPAGHGAAWFSAVTATALAGGLLFRTIRRTQP